MTIGARLKEERTRLGMSQTEFAALARVKKGTQISWEKDTSSPTAAALAAFAARGVDAMYVLTGNRTIDPPISDEDHMSLVLDEVEQDLVNLPIAASADDHGQRVLNTSQELIEKVLAVRATGAVSENIEERAKSLLSAVHSPKRRTELQVAAFAQRQRNEDVAREGLDLWLRNSSYKPSENVLEKMIQITVQYHVHHEALVRLVRAVYSDAITNSTH